VNLFSCVRLKLSIIDEKCHVYINEKDGKFLVPKFEFGGSFRMSMEGVLV
jgi:hypothetical protein